MKLSAQQKYMSSSISFLMLLSLSLPLFANDNASKNLEGLLLRSGVIVTGVLLVIPAVYEPNAKNLTFAGAGLVMIASTLCFTTNQNAVDKIIGKYAKLEAEDYTTEYKPKRRGLIGDLIVKLKNKNDN